MSENAHPILTRAITVLVQDTRGGQRSQFVFLPRPMADDAPEREYQEITRSTLAQDLDAIRNAVKNLVSLAVMGRARDGIGIEEEARQLTRHIVPEGLFERILGTTFHPRFDIGPDLASGIPWELLEETRSTCECGPSEQNPEKPAQPCSRCGRIPEPRPVKLVLSRHLSHLVPGRGVPRPGARAVLLVHDPTGDLCSRDPTPEKICRSHLDTIAGLFKSQGYEVDILSGPNATRGRFLQALRNPDLAALYFYGHGWYSREGNEGCLLLADGEIAASAIEELTLEIPFTFLNACEGSAAARDWDLDGRHGNVASAFARSPVQTVIAPLWPVVNHQAAESALEFFQLALAGNPLAEALRGARESSYRHYQGGSPHISWMAYRYFGNPNSTLDLTEPAPGMGIESLVSANPVTNRFFDERGVLNMESTGFDLLNILIRAARRRNLHRRKLVSIADFLAGLTRKGDLTRWVLRTAGFDPDQIYKQLLESVESPVSPEDMAGDATGQAKEEAFVTLWVISRREQFSPALLQVLDGASQNTMAGDSGGLISEERVLSAFLSVSAPQGRIHSAFPASETLRQCLQQGLGSKTINGNGEMMLDGLDAHARRIIAAAHLFSQQRRISPIPHRLFLASLLAESGSCGARLCRLAGGEPETAFLAMLASANPDKSEETEEPMAFGLTADVCRRVVTPVLQEARRITPTGSLVGEMELVRAFCAQADSSFKQATKNSFLALDLDQWPHLDKDALDLMSNLNNPAWRVIQAAFKISCARGSLPVPNRALLAAFLSEPGGIPTQALCRPESWREAFCRELVNSIPAKPAAPPVLTRPACARSIEPMIKQALGNEKGRPLDARSLFNAFCAATDPQFKQALKKSPFLLDLDTVVAFPLAADVSSIAIGGFPKSQFDDTGWKLMFNALMLARCQNCVAIHTIHLLGASLLDEVGSLASRLKSAGVSNQLLLTQLLNTPVEAGGILPAPRETYFSVNAAGIVRGAIETARGAGRSAVNEADLCAALENTRSNVMAAILEKIGVIQPNGLLLSRKISPHPDASNNEWN